MSVKIILDKNVELTSDRFQWKLKRIIGSRIDENGNTVIHRKLIGYYSTLGGMVKGYLEDVGKASNATTINELTQVLKDAETLTNRTLRQHKYTDMGTTPKVPEGGSDEEDSEDGTGDNTKEVEQPLSFM